MIIKIFDEKVTQEGCDKAKEYCDELNADGVEIMTAEHIEHANSIMNDAIEKSLPPKGSEPGQYYQHPLTKEWRLINNNA